ncbi:MCP methyltransferase, CheR-type [Magnetococcus marinus MC-1]|uniref:Chemotaxis protein methyltransferase n=1 Tax=Magnetococcus marinus (strain ATCC BAA-1437 / JCM 17883 / MC-1) TaxID=156889 RepID=A0L5A3_MAGMM|nr:protein-glutamate O-methyltransferase CheR [Magnetococcus marinus]ABK43146.1 MCP methyltransferase, CheR-type [Magnetococcus marinus MC-1]
MNDASYHEPLGTPLTDQEFQQLAQLIQGQLGIQMPASKKTMLSARLQKRLRVLKIESMQAYVQWITDPVTAGQEYINFLDIVTTNKTDFFREPVHFDFLTHTLFPQLSQLGLGQGRAVKIWSAGCSTGEEPYTIAMVAKEYEAQLRQPFKVDILATDISSRVLKQAKNGVYGMERISPISQALRKKYLLRHKDPNSDKVRMGPELRRMLRFGRLNFMDGEFGLKERMHVIFCRNVMIYFDRPTQQRLVNQFCQHLEPGGFLFIGHSETLNGLDVPLELLQPTIYRYAGRS